MMLNQNGDLDGPIHINLSNEYHRQVDSLKQPSISNSNMYIKEAYQQQSFRVHNAADSAKNLKIDSSQNISVNK